MSLRLGPFGRGRFRTASGGRAQLQASDLTFLGQAEATGTTYANPCLALRYVGGERRFLAYEYDSGEPDGVGDLVEYHLTSELKNGGDHWVLGTLPDWVETRRWANWSTHARIVAGQDAGTYPVILQGGVEYGNGGHPAAFYWDEAQGILWYAWQPAYPGGAKLWPAFSAVKLTDGEAGGNVSSGNIYGPYYFKDASLYDDFKDASCGIIPIPASRQAAMGGKYIAAGHHCANIGTRGARSLGMWVINDLPDMGSPPAQNAALWPAAVHIYDTGSASGVVPPNMKAPNVSFPAADHASQGNSYYYVTAGGTTTQYSSATGGTVGTAVGDCLYQYDYGSDCIYVRMNTGAAGGTWVPEIYNGSAWVAPTGWAVSVGTADLAEAETVFYWPYVAHSQYALPGVSANYWVRLRRTTEGTSGGDIETMILTIRPAGDADRPLNVGGYSPPGSEQYDASHYSYTFSEYFWGGAWVTTDNVEGLAYFGCLKTSGQWYGAAPMYAQPAAGGTPTKYYHCMTDGEDFSNGNKSDGPELPYFFPFDYEQVMECAAGTRNRNATGLNPVSYTGLFAQFPGLIAQGTVANTDSSFYEDPTFACYGWGHTVLFDTVTKQLILMLTNGRTYSRNVLAFWQVR